MPLELSCENIPNPGEEIEDADNDDDDPVDGAPPSPPIDHVLEANEAFSQPPQLHSLNYDVNRDVINPTDDVSQPANEEEESAVSQGRSPNVASATPTPSSTISITNHRPTRGVAARQRELMKNLVQADLI